jgi:rubrerythrin
MAGKRDLEEQYASLVKAIEEHRSNMLKALEEKRSNPEPPETCSICGKERTEQSTFYYCRQCEMSFCESHLTTVGPRYSGNVMYAPYQACPQCQTRVKRSPIKVDVSSAVLKALEEQCSAVLKELEEKRSKKWWQFWK